MKKIRLKNRLKSANLFVITGIITLLALYGYRLGSFVKGNNSYETLDFLHINGLKQIFDNITFAPIKLLDLVAYKIDHPNVTYTRLISALLIIISVITFYRILYKWNTARIAILGTVLFATNSYIISSARFTNFEAMQILVVPSIILIGTWLKSKRYVNRMWLGAGATGIMLYVPGFIIIVSLLASVFRKRLKLAWKFVSPKVHVLTIAGFALVILPIFYGLFRNINQWSTFLGIDKLANGHFLEVGKDFINIFDSLFYKGLHNMDYFWLSGSPIIDIATTVLIAMGVYNYFVNQHTLRLKLLLFLGVVSSILIATSSILSVSLILPILYLFAANGLVFLAASWFTVFPFNPIAKNLANTCLALLVIVIATFHIYRYFVVWPSTPATKRALSSSVMIQYINMN